jgi:beta-galactosidase
MLCEYCHSMGNSTGNIDAYWRLFEDSTAAAAADSNGSSDGTAAAAPGSNGGGWSGSSVIGGFIWDWADQSLVKREAVDGKEVRAFRGLGLRVGYAFNSSLHA